MHFVIDLVARENRLFIYIVYTQFKLLKMQTVHADIIHVTIFK